MGSDLAGRREPVDVRVVSEPPCGGALRVRNRCVMAREHPAPADTPQFSARGPGATDAAVVHRDYTVSGSQAASGLATAASLPPN